jgi:hypothetical protein
LDYFRQNNSSLSFPAQNFFWKIFIVPELWTQRAVKVIKNIKLKVYQYFYVSAKLGNNFHAMRYAFKSLNTSSGEIECTGLVKDLKLADVHRLPPKRLCKCCLSTLTFRQ